LLDPLSRIHNEKRIPYDWIWRLIENVSKSCSHGANYHDEDEDPDMGLRLVHDCYDTQPIYELGSRELARLVASAAKEDHNCCDYSKEVMRE